ASLLPGLDARCLIITGEHDIFSAGYDLGGFPDEMLAEEADRLVANPFAAALEAIEQYDYPTVAALNGHAIGGGLELALACALRGSKRVIGSVLAAGAALDADTEAELIELRRACFSSEDFREAVRAFAEKRPPVWRDR